MAQIGLDTPLKGLVGARTATRLADKLELPQSRYRHFVRALGTLVSGMQRTDFLKGQRRARAIEEGRRYWQIAATRGKAQHLFAMPESLLGVAA